MEGESMSFKLEDWRTVLNKSTSKGLAQPQSSQIPVTNPSSFK